MEQGNSEQGNTEHTDTDPTTTEQVDTEQSDAVETVAQDRTPTPGDLLRSLPIEAETRGTRYVSAQAMQARLFSVYDAAAAAEEALAMVQQQLTLTLNRSYYEADEIKSLAAQLDSLLALDSVDLTDALDLNEGDLVSEE
ncbi:MAG TPA: hypothetical protein VG226_02525 [Acidimicrobiales bacterium]|nr:hypothetical protein [Acidimicrobiales bacterium]